MNEPTPNTTLRVACDACDASPSITHEARYVTCEACGTNLVIKRIGSSRIAKKLVKLGEEPASDETDEEKLARLEDELRDAERKWNRRRRDLSSRDEEGNRTTPSRAGAITIALAGLGFGIAFGGQSGSWLVFAFVVLIGLVAGWVTFSKAQSYGAAENRWYKRRAELREEIRSLKPPDENVPKRQGIIRRRFRRR